MSRTVRILILALAISTVLFVSAVSFGAYTLLSQANSLRITRTAATQLNCRAGVTNNADDQFRHDVGDLFDAAIRSDTKVVRSITDRVQNRPPTNDIIRKQCGADAVATTSTTKGK